MPYKNQILYDNLNGNKYEILETASDTNGERVTIKMELCAKGKIAPDHIHLKQKETFKVLKGSLTYFLHGKENILKEGEEIVLPANVPHNHYNTSDKSVVLIQKVEPAYDIDYFFETLIGLTNDGKVKNGNFSFIQAMTIGKYLDSPSRLANIPLKLQEILIHTIGPIGRLLGFRALYKRYSGIEK